MNNEKPHVITEREKRAWQQGKNKKRIDLPDFSTRQLIKFLKFVVEDRSSMEFELHLQLSANDVAFYKTKYSINSIEDARTLLNKTEPEFNSQLEKEREAERIQSRKDRMAAERRLDMSNKPLPKSPRVKRDYKKDDAARQKRFDEQQSEQPVKSAWRLPTDSRDTADTIKRFENDIILRGMQFCVDKYNVSRNDIKAEAQRLGLKINWDMVRR